MLEPYSAVCHPAELRFRAVAGQVTPAEAVVTQTLSSRLVPPGVICHLAEVVASPRLVAPSTACTFGISVQISYRSSLSGVHKSFRIRRFWGSFDRESLISHHAAIRETCGGFRARRFRRRRFQSRFRFLYPPRGTPRVLYPPHGNLQRFYIQRFVIITVLIF
jgi:hypothetical protein